MAQGQLAARHQRQTLGTLRRCPRACGRRAAAADPRYGRSALARRGSLARARASHDRRTTGERKYYLSNLPADAPIKQLAGAIKARWVCEQAHQQLKEELGLDHFEGRSWKGLHRHALMSMIALAILQSLRRKQAKGEKRISGPPPKPSLPAIRQAIINRLARPPDKPCPHCGRRTNAPPYLNLPKWC